MERTEQTAVLQFFKALADESRLKIIGILANRECSVEELAALLNLKAPTVSHHLARLKGLGLVRMRAEGTTHVYALDADALRRMSKESLPERITALAPDVSPHHWERKVLGDFFEGDRLKEIPASRKKRAVILDWLARQFETGVRYPERDVNEVIKRHHADTATLRRELIGGGWMRRENGIYWRIARDQSADTEAHAESGAREPADG